jgi:chromosome segregation ATPase
MPKAEQINWGESAPSEPTTPAARVAQRKAALQRESVDRIATDLAEQERELTELEAEHATWSRQDRESREWQLDRRRENIASLKTRLKRVRALDLEKVAERLTQLESLSDREVLNARANSTREKLWQATLLRLDVYREVQAARAELDRDLRELADLRAQLDGFEKAPSYVGVAYQTDHAFNVSVHRRLEEHLGLTTGPIISRTSDPRLSAFDYALGE